MRHIRPNNNPTSIAMPVQPSSHESRLSIVYIATPHGTRYYAVIFGLEEFY